MAVAAPASTERISGATHSARDGESNPLRLDAATSCSLAFGRLVGQFDTTVGTIGAQGGLAIARAPRGTGKAAPKQAIAVAEFLPEAAEIAWWTGRILRFAPSGGAIVSASSLDASGLDAVSGWPAPPASGSILATSMGCTASGAPASGADVGFASCPPSTLGVLVSGEAASVPPSVTGETASVGARESGTATTSAALASASILATSMGFTASDAPASGADVGFASCPPSTLGVLLPPQPSSVRDIANTVTASFLVMALSPGFFLAKPLGVGTLLEAAKGKQHFREGKLWSMSVASTSRTVW